MKIGQYLAKIWTRVYCAGFLAHPVDRPHHQGSIYAGGAAIRARLSINELRDLRRSIEAEPRIKFENYVSCKVHTCNNGQASCKR